MPDKTITPAVTHDNPREPERDGAVGWTKGLRRVTERQYGVEVEANPTGDLWVTIAWHGPASVTDGQASYSTDEDLLANARLNAAAPAMAEALADFVAMGEQYGWDAASTGRDLLMRNARTALAKARGEDA